MPILFYDVIKVFNKIHPDNALIPNFSTPYLSNQTIVGNPTTVSNLNYSFGSLTNIDRNLNANFPVPINSTKSPYSPLLPADPIVNDDLNANLTGALLNPTSIENIAFRKQLEILDENFLLKDSKLINEAFDVHFLQLTEAKRELAGQAQDKLSPHHMIYGYFVEATRIDHIIERLIGLATNGDELGILDPDAMQILTTTESLFFKSSSPHSNMNIRSNIRPNSEATRRNMFKNVLGLDLPHGAIDSKNNPNYPYPQPESPNLGFTNVLEKFMGELWNAHININNHVGASDKDVIAVENLAVMIKEMLLSKRTNDEETFRKHYGYTKYAKEEFSSCMKAKWMHRIVAHNSPLLKSLNCTGITIDARLKKLGQKAGIPAHSQSGNFIDLGVRMAVLCRLIENGEFDNSITIEEAMNPNSPLGEMLLKIINLYSYTTGRNVKVRK